jgi:hypothetical protein
MIKHRTITSIAGAGITPKPIKIKENLLTKINWACLEQRRNPEGNPPLIRRNRVRHARGEDPREPIPPVIEQHECNAVADMHCDVPGLSAPAFISAVEERGRVIERLRLRGRLFRRLGSWSCLGSQRIVLVVRGISLFNRQKKQERIKSITRTYNPI